MCTSKTYYELYLFRINPLVNNKKLAHLVKIRPNSIRSANNAEITSFLTFEDTTSSGSDYSD